MRDRRQGPRQAWTWSRMDGSITQHMVRPSSRPGCWVEEWPYGCHWWAEGQLCDSPEEAARQAREHFRRVVSTAETVLARLG